ncbi:HK97 family phage prohead protease [Sutterella sp.]|uniref:HK97 family phage prohead protease n=1 Tax=Sutterella sp. TaxID=1981025 RepID=UPI0026E059B9|nr:HK97 family phage prohead protease [Sutterella sp.]MDO5531417.1 HK97 family phage prohead protease [Sutterella sp.]
MTDELRKTKDVSLAECRLKVDSERRVFSGYASVFDGVDAYGDTIRKGAYENSLAKYGMPKMFFGHEYAIPIGKWTVCREDSIGLYVEGELTEGNPQADAVYAALKHGTVDGLSVGLWMRGGTYTEKEDGSGLEIHDVGRLTEISVCCFPADGKARVTTVRSEDVDGVQTVRDLEQLLREAGLSKSVATALVAKARQVFGTQRESEADEQAQKQILERLQRLEKLI